MSETSHMPPDPGQPGPERPRLQLHTGQRIEEPTPRNVWDIEYDREVWRLRELGIKAKIAHILFDRIPQPWLKDPAKRWARWRLSTGLGAESAASGTRAISHFAQFLASPAVRVVRLDQVDRPLLERYLAHLHSDYAGRAVHRNFIGQLNLFFLAIRQHRWNDALPASTVFFHEDFPHSTSGCPGP
ncbi:hypothetical protein ACFC5Z_33990 [Streptomyces sp. NPDC056004]|uniref:hypothetical protein n=1 Tax=Streptomyces sp. NPDC056004 TaxID=3345677 RepID=UPI0035E0B8E6